MMMRNGGVKNEKGDPGPPGMLAAFDFLPIRRLATEQTNDSATADSWLLIISETN